MGRRKGEGAQARTGGRWANRREGAGTGLVQVGGTGRAGKLAGGGRNRGQAGGRTKKGRLMSAACLVVAAQQQKLKLICSYFIHGVV